jgi:hypothetical protein
VIDERLIGERFRALAPELSERGRRLWAASEARVLGRGGIAAVARASGISENTIRKGIREIDAGERLSEGRVRRQGGGRKPIAATDPELIVALERLVAEDCRGDPMQVLLWTSKSVRRLAVDLREQGHEFISRRSLTCCVRLGTACSPTARAWRARSIPIGTRSFG